MKDLNRKRILFISHSTATGGSEDDFLRLLKYFSLKKDEYIVEAMFPKNNRWEEFSIYAERVGFIKGIYFPPVYEGLKYYVKYLLRYFQQRKQLAHFILDRQFDLCVINVSVLLWPMIVLSRKQLKVLVFMRELVRPAFVAKFVFRIIESYSDYVISISRKNTDAYVKATHSHKIRTIWSAIEHDEKELPDIEELTAKYRLHTDREFRILSVGGLNKNKNQLLLIDAVSLLLKKGNRNIVVDLVGEYIESSPYVIELRKRIGMSGFAAVFRFHGKMEKSNMPNYYKAADCVVVSSLTEGFSFVMLEAFKNGTLLIATKVGDIPEIVKNGQNGYLVAYDKNELASELERIIKSPSISAEIARNGYLTFREINDLKGNLEKTESIFLEIMESTN